MMELSVEQEQLVLVCLYDYWKLLKVGMSIDCPLLENRLLRIDGIGRLIADVVTETETTDGDTSGDTSGPNSPTGRNNAQGDDEHGHQRVNRGHSSAGVDTADRGNDITGFEIQDSMGGAADPGAPIDGKIDDISNDSPGRRSG